MKQGRLYFFDNLRAFVIFLVIVLHGSMSYMAYAPEWWYVVDSQQSLVFTALVLLLDVPIMLVLFFISGYFALPSLRRRTPGEFLKEKFVRIGLPWLFGALFLAPLIAYMIIFTNDIPIGFLQFWSQDFWGVWYQQSVYWFLGILFFLFILLTGAVALRPGLRQVEQKAERPTWKLFVAFGGLMTAGFLLINQFYPVDTWTHAWYLLMFQPLRVPLYVGYFVLGLYAYRSGWFTDEGYRPNLVGWGVLFGLSGLLYIVFRLFVFPTAPSAFLMQAGNALLFNTFCLSALIAGGAFFRRYVNSDAPFWRSVARNSYAVYFIHPLILFPLAYLFLAFAIPLILKAPLLILLASLLCWAVSALVLTRAPLLRRVF